MVVVNVSVGNSIAATNGAQQGGSPLDLGLAGDCLLFDGVGVVTYRVHGTKSAVKGSLVETGASYYVVQHALRREVNRREVLGSSGRFRIGDVVFEIPAIEMPVQPREGDAIFQNGERWSVLQADQATLNTRWRVYARAGA